eukprot:CAMPEP_0176430554 /NCGR_PEP_ID=MMETSP0127-20121128/14319_1 /TAXON_ID=938130 /ORGANISM="Platyophrya macrostoma, Strain WH" /LENGTH=199 /DNA_ID=CAMNT_0017812459 /DNA_START=98 /DNA_END=697 /DNA_ORIENTATION=+
MNPDAQPSSVAAAPVTRQLTREEFLLQMGLTSDDVNGKAAAAAIETRSSGGDIVLRAEPTPQALLIASSEAPVVLHDDQWLRSTVFTDINGLQAESQGDPNNAAKKAIMESYKISRSYGTHGSTLNDGGVSKTPNPQGSPQTSTQDSVIAAIDLKANDLVTEEDHTHAQDYKASLLEEFRKRKKNGEAKVPPVSPPRQR